MGQRQQNGILSNNWQADESVLTDAELLEDYLATRDASAFERLLHRHGCMVYGVCRRVLENDADAHDAFQATFLVFVQKAMSIHPRGQVGNWLYGVAHKTALKARAMGRLRRAKEMQAAFQGSAQSMDDALQERLASLDEALSRLPDKFRSAIVLCDLEANSIQEAARRLNCPPGTVASRLARGRDLLARRLGRGAVGLGVLAVTVSHPPASLISSTVECATRAAANPSAAASVAPPRVAGLIEGVVREMHMTNWQSLSTVVFVCCLIGGGFLGYAALQEKSDQGVGEGRSPPATQKGDKPKPDKETIQGVWVARSAERNGEKFTEERLKNWEELHFKDGKLTRTGAIPDEGTYTINPDKKLKEIDLFGDTWVGIYELKGNTLKVAIRCGEDRPTEFDSKDALVIVFERKKPEK